MKIDGEKIQERISTSIRKVVENRTDIATALGITDSFGSKLDLSDVLKHKHLSFNQSGKIGLKPRSELANLHPIAAPKCKKGLNPVMAENLSSNLIQISESNCDAHKSTKQRAESNYQAGNSISELMMHPQKKPITAIDKTSFNVPVINIQMECLSDKTRSRNIENISQRPPFRAGSANLLRPALGKDSCNTRRVRSANTIAVTRSRASVNMYSRTLVAELIKSSEPRNLISGSKSLSGITELEKTLVVSSGNRSDLSSARKSYRLE